MRIDFNRELKTIDGTQPLPEIDEARRVTGKNVILRNIATNALLTPSDGLSGQEKMSRWKLAQKVNASNDGPVALELEEVALIKKLIGEFYPPLVVGQAWEMLEGVASE